jgi:hypothetical protein
LIIAISYLSTYIGDISEEWGNGNVALFLFGIIISYTSNKIENKSELKNDDKI